MFGVDFSKVCSRNSAVILEDMDLLVVLVAKMALKTRGNKKHLSNMHVTQGHLLKSMDSPKQLF